MRDIYAGMMLLFPVGKGMIGWVVDSETVIYRPHNIPLMCNKVEWSNGVITYEVVNNIHLYHQRWLEISNG